MTPLTFTGLVLGENLTEPHVTIRRADEPEERIYPYLPDAALVNAVNLALLLSRPLLLMGEPGSGKSQLARALAYELYQGRPRVDGIALDYRDFYREWLIKSTSKALDGLYEYDAIARLGDAQTQQKSDSPERLAKRNYLRLGPMGDAFRRSQKPEGRVVLLIDEIDKADLDFANDLLNELDRSRFTMPETSETVAAGKDAKPIVIITSNGEKPLPDAFLRRCLFHQIAPFDQPRLREIVRRRFATELPENAILTDQATRLFVDIRAEIEKNKISTGKNVSTAEFLDWFSALHYYRNLGDHDPALTPEAARLRDEARRLDGSLSQIPFRQVLFKHQTTWLEFEKRTVPVPLPNVPGNALANA